jgi:hypothetical protein
MASQRYSLEIHFLTQKTVIRQWPAAKWIVLILSTFVDLARATPVLEQMYEKLKQLRSSGKVQNFYCIYELYSADPHIDFGLKMMDPLPTNITSKMLDRGLEGEPQLENEEVFDALETLGLSDLNLRLREIQQSELLRSGGLAFRLRPPDKELVEETKAIATTAGFMFRNEHSDILKLAYFLHMYANVTTSDDPMKHEVELLSKWELDRLRSNGEAYLVEAYVRLPQQINAVRRAIQLKSEV